MITTMMADDEVCLLTCIRSPPFMYSSTKYSLFTFGSSITLLVGQTEKKGKGSDRKRSKNVEWSGRIIDFSTNASKDNSGAERTFEKNGNGDIVMPINCHLVKYTQITLFQKPTKLSTIIDYHHLVELQNVNVVELFHDSDLPFDL
jgi:hypothetical protein